MPLIIGPTHLVDTKLRLCVSQRSRHTSRWYLRIFGAFCVWQTSLNVTEVGRSHGRFCRRQGLNFLLWGTLTLRAGRVNRDPHRPISQGHRPNRDNTSSVARMHTFTSISFSNSWSEPAKGNHVCLIIYTWEEPGEPGDNLHGHEENMETQKRGQGQNLEPSSSHVGK